MDAIQKSASIEKGPHDEDIAIHTETFAIKREALGHDLPARYWMSPGFIGTVAALCFGNISNYASWVQPSNSLTVINESIGPSDNITWVSLAYTLGLAVGKSSIFSKGIWKRFLTHVCKAFWLLGDCPTYLEEDGE